MVGLASTGLDSGGKRAGSVYNSRSDAAGRRPVIQHGYGVTRGREIEAHPDRA